MEIRHDYVWFHLNMIQEETITSTMMIDYDKIIYLGLNERRKMYIFVYNKSNQYVTEV